MKGKKVLFSFSGREENERETKVRKEGTAQKT